MQMRPKASQKSLLSHLTPALGSGSIHISCCTVAVKKQTQGNFHFQACSWRVFSAGMQQRKRQCVNAKFAQCNPRGESSTVLDPFQMCGSSWDKFGHFAAHLAQAADKRALESAVNVKIHWGKISLLNLGCCPCCRLKVEKLILCFVRTGVVTP